MVACLGLFLYEMLPEYLFLPTSALVYFVLPSVAIFAVFVIIPNLLTKGQQTSVQAQGIPEQASQPQVETISLEQAKEPGLILPDGNGSSMIQGLIQGQALQANEVQAPAVIQAPAVNEMAVQDMVSRAMEPVQKDSTRMQDTITDLRNEINSIKGSMDSLSSMVESSLTDLKSFQAELANPLNFMRKYFDSIDIKSLSDPSLPLHIEHLPLSEPSQYPSVEKAVPEPVSQEAKAEPHPVETAVDLPPKSQSKEEVLSSDQDQTFSFKQMLNGKMTLGKMMTTISLIEEILQTLGRDSIDVLIDQCKLMGLKQEDEHIVYNVINMMDKSGLSVKDTLIMLYKFGKVMGMNDRESDLIYARMMMNQGKNHDSPMTMEKKVG